MKALWTTRQDGDLRTVGRIPLTAEMVRRRSLVVARPWVTLDQVHGAHVVTVDRNGGVIDESLGDQGVPTGDALVSDTFERALAVMTADCASLALADPHGTMAAVHAGWRGLLAGVIEKTVEAMRRGGTGPIVAALGPCIHPECYEFGLEGLDALGDRFGPGVRARTATGSWALDLPAAVRAAVDRSGAAMVNCPSPCTACHPDYFSHRARGDVGRQALVMWRE
ncbi:MAG: polyphenol oxidase family protein [Acidimicrobiales bacterium]